MVESEKPEPRRHLCYSQAHPYPTPYFRGDGTRQLCELSLPSPPTPLLSRACLQLCLSPAPSSGFASSESVRLLSLVLYKYPTKEPVRTQLSPVALLTRPVSVTPVSASRLSDDKKAPVPPI